MADIIIPLAELQDRASLELESSSRVDDAGNMTFEHFAINGHVIKPGDNIIITSTTDDEVVEYTVKDTYQQLDISEQIQYVQDGVTNATAIMKEIYDQIEAEQGWPTVTFSLFELEVIAFDPTGYTLFQEEPGVLVLGSAKNPVLASEKIGITNNSGEVIQTVSVDELYNEFGDIIQYHISQGNIVSYNEDGRVEPTILVENGSTPLPFSLWGVVLNVEPLRSHALHDEISNTIASLNTSEKHWRPLEVLSFDNVIEALGERSEVVVDDELVGMIAFSMARATIDPRGPYEEYKTQQSFYDVYVDERWVEDNPVLLDRIRNRIIPNPEDYEATENGISQLTMDTFSPEMYRDYGYQASTISREVEVNTASEDNKVETGVALEAEAIPCKIESFSGVADVLSNLLERVLDIELHETELDVFPSQNSPHCQSLDVEERGK